MKVNDLGYPKAEPNDIFQFNCSHCGDCCRNVKQAVPLNGLDLYRLMRYFKRPMEQIIEKYTEVVFIGDSNFPLMMLKTTHDDTCIFYKSGCSVQEAKPLPCRLYPYNIKPGNHDGLSYCIVSQKPHHYTGKTHRVGNWMRENLTPDDRRYMIGWFSQALQIGLLAMEICQKPDGAAIYEQLLARIIWLLYFYYEAGEDFWPQHERNMALLMDMLKSSANDRSQ